MQEIGIVELAQAIKNKAVNRIHFRRFPEKKIPGSLPELVEGKFLQLPST